MDKHAPPWCAFDLCLHRASTVEKTPSTNGVDYRPIIFFCHSRAQVCRGRHDVQSLSQPRGTRYSRSGGSDPSHSVARRCRSSNHRHGFGRSSPPSCSRDRLSTQTKSGIKPATPPEHPSDCSDITKRWGTDSTANSAFPVLSLSPFLNKIATLH